MGHLLNMALKSTSAAGVATVYWEHGYVGTCGTRSWAIKKNGVIIADGNGSTYASGSFTVANGDTIAVDSSSGVTGAACNDAKATVYRDGNDVASQTVIGLNQTATATWTIATVQASYNLISGFLAP